MKLFADECVWEVTRVFVQQLGHELATVEERLLIPRTKVSRIYI
jgi:hypothetical protein